MKKKIIFVTTALWIGGIETALINTLNAIDYTKYDVCCMITRADLTLKEQVNANCKLIVVDREKAYSFKNPYPFSKLAHFTEETINPSRIHRMLMWATPGIKYIENYLYINYVKHLMRKNKYDTAIIYSDVVGELTVKAIRADKYVMFYHHGSMRHVYHDNIAYKKSNHIVAVSNNQADALKKFVPEYSDKIMYIHNLVDYKKIRTLSNARNNDFFDDNIFNIVTVGRFAVEKGIDLAVQACEELVKQGQTNFCWWIVGDGPMYSSIKKMVEDSGMSSYINLVGMKENPYPYIKNADLYIQPSRVEAFGLSIIEALVLGKVVISTETDGAKEILMPDKGILTTTNPLSIAKCISKTMDNHELCEYIQKRVENIKWEVETQYSIKMLESIV